MKRILHHIVIAAVLFCGPFGLGSVPASYAQDNETAALEATVHITPQTYNLKRNGRFLNAIITLPAGYSAAAVREDSLSLYIVLGDNETSAGVEALSAVPVPLVETMLNVKFDNREVKELIQDHYDSFPENVTFLVTGSLDDDTLFSGEDTIRVIYPGNKGKGGKK